MSLSESPEKRPRPVLSNNTRELSQMKHVARVNRAPGVSVRQAQRLAKEMFRKFQKARETGHIGTV